MTLVFQAQISYIRFFNDPAEEGKPYSLKIVGEFSNNSYFELYLLNGQTLILFCYLPRPCDVTFENHYNVTTNIRSPQFEIELTVYNVTRAGVLSTEAEWNLETNDKEYGKQRQSFNISVYNKGKEPTCNQYYNTDGIFISCSISDLYPEIRCHLTVKHYQEVLIDSTNFVYNSEIGKSKSRCTYHLSHLKSGSYQAAIIVYPNVTGTKQDMKYGTQRSLNISIDIPEVQLLNCPETVKENEEIVCQCSVLSSALKYSLMWWDSFAQMKSDNGILKVKVKRSEKDYLCHAVNEIGTKSATLTYTPKIIAKSIDLRCNLSRDTDFHVICATKKIFPRGKCEFKVKFNHTVVLLPNQIMYQHSQIYQDAMQYFSTTCNVQIPSIYLTAGLHEVIAFMYPNITGNATDMSYSVNTSLYILQEDTKHENVHSETDLHFLAPIVLAGAIFVSLTLACVVCFVKVSSGKTERPDIYDTIITEHTALNS
ncbi:polymorphic transmembrane cluster 2 transmembrane protein 2 [Biomphalaria glabrata]|nr:polymorphic transmembrane cluster 2 transmembrane protein 2 [Biomphalaria glabrata]